MIQEADNSHVNGIANYTALFESLPGSCVLLGNNAPHYTVLAATPEYLLQTGYTKDGIIGKGIFEMSPANPGDTTDTGVSDLKHSLEQVRLHKKPHPLPVQRYDIAGKDGSFSERYWSAVNKPVLSTNGDVQYIIHTAEDITGLIKSDQIEYEYQELQQVYKKVKESESRYSTLFNSIDQGFCVLEMIFDAQEQPLDYVFLETNPVFEKQTGLISANGKTAKQLVPNLESHWFKRYATVASTGQSVRFTERSEAMGRWFDVYAFRVGGRESRRVALLFSDITDSKRAEGILKESETRFKDLADDSPIFVFILDPDPMAPVSYWNRTWLKYTGQTYEAALGRAWDGIIHDDDIPEVMKHYLPAFENKEQYFIPAVRVKRHDGVYRWHAFKGNPRFSSTGDFNGFVGVGLDVHEQKLAEQALRRSEEALEQKVEERTQELEKQKAFIANILEASMNGIYALKAVRNSEGEITDFQYLFANNNIAKALRLMVNEIIGASMFALIPENRINGFFDLFCKVLLSTETFRGETHFKAQGINAWYDYVVVPIDNETLVVSIDDISEKKNAAIEIEEQRNLLNNILRNSSNGISVTEMIRDESGKVIDAKTIMANDAAVNYIGLPKDVFLSKTAVELDPNIIDSTYGQTCLKTLETGEPSLSQYYMELTGRWQELTISKMDEDHLIHIFTDITPIKEAHLQLERSVEELKRSNQNLEEFAYAASHDLKEPVRKIQFFADRLRVELDGSLSESQQGTFKRMEHAASRMGSLIDDLLMYSHVSKGVEQVEVVDLNIKIKNVLEDLELEINEKEAVIKVEELPTIKGHRRQLQQLFQNLISNAIKYNAPDVKPEVRITSHIVKGKDTSLTLQAEEGNRSYHLVEVKDNGIGFPQEDAARIFNVFTRLHGNAEYKGTGVGLSIARKVAESHNGFIWAESKPGEGAAFKVLLPAE